MKASLTHTHLPPLAYSITRNSVFSVSITSNSLTIKRETGKYRGEERNKKTEEKRRQRKKVSLRSNQAQIEIFSLMQIKVLAFKENLYIHTQAIQYIFLYTLLGIQYLFIYIYQ